MGGLQVTSVETIEQLLRAQAPVSEKDFAARERDCIEGYEANLEQPVRALSRARTFAMTLPRRRGHQQVIAGEADGWREMERWWVLETLATHLIGPHIASNAQVLLGFALAQGEATPAGWMATALEARMKKSPDAYEGQFFPRFMLHLHRTLAPGSAAGPGSIPDLGPYADVFSSWSDPDALAGALAEVCTYRIDAVVTEGPDEVSEFRFAPLLPLEVAAVAAIRRARNEPWTPVSHPLLDTPLAKIPPKRTYDPSTDPWFERITAAAKAASRHDPDCDWPVPTQSD